MMSAAIAAVLLVQFASPWNESPWTSRGLRALPSETGAGIDATRDRLDTPGPQVMPFKTTILPDGSIKFTDKTFIFDKLGVDFDVTDWVERLHGRSPYRAEQMGIADATRPDRTRMALQYRQQNAERALAALPGVLNAVWAEARLDASVRKNILFQLWDECAEQGPADVMQASGRARGIILSFIRERLPPGSPEAFDTAELDALNARRSSTERFSPYR